MKLTSHPFAFPRRRRLTSHEQYVRVFAEGEELPGRYVVIWVLREASWRGRVGIVATKRTFHDAVERNRAKRLIRESFRRLQVELDDTAWVLVVLARRRILRVKQPEVEKELRKLCGRQGLLRVRG